MDQWVRNACVYTHEIKLRVLYILYSNIISFGCSYLFSEQIIYVLALPLEKARQGGASTYPFGSHLIFTELTEAFFASITISVFVSCWVLVAWQLPYHI